LGQVIAFYNSAVKDLPTRYSLKHLRLPGTSVVLDNKSDRLAEIYLPNNRRIWVKLADIQKRCATHSSPPRTSRFSNTPALTSADGPRLYRQLTQPGRPQGGSTITQPGRQEPAGGQRHHLRKKTARNDRCSRMERALTKAESSSSISTRFISVAEPGASRWRARSYFGKPAKALSAVEGALLAGLAKGPNYFNPDHPP